MPAHASYEQVPSRSTGDRFGFLRSGGIFHGAAMIPAEDAIDNVGEVSHAPTAAVVHETF